MPDEWPARRIDEAQPFNSFGILGKPTATVEVLNHFKVVDSVRDFRCRYGMCPVMPFDFNWFVHNFNMGLAIAGRSLRRLTQARSGLFCIDRTRTPARIFV